VDLQVGFVVLGEGERREAEEEGQTHRQAATSFSGAKGKGQTHHEQVYRFGNM
jgi:hypothetical protein